jgi:hypothetical protein
MRVIFIVILVLLSTYSYSSKKKKIKKAVTNSTKITTDSCSIFLTSLHKSKSIINGSNSYNETSLVQDTLTILFNKYQNCFQNLSISQIDSILGKPIVINKSDSINIDSSYVYTFAPSFENFFISKNKRKLKQLQIYFKQNKFVYLQYKLRTFPKPNNDNIILSEKIQRKK